MQYLDDKLNAAAEQENAKENIRLYNEHHEWGRYQLPPIDMVSAWAVPMRINILKRKTRHVIRSMVLGEIVAKNNYSHLFEDGTFILRKSYPLMDRKALLWFIVSSYCDARTGRKAPAFFRLHGFYGDLKNPQHFEVTFLFSQVEHAARFMCLHIGIREGLITAPCSLEELNCLNIDDDVFITHHDGTVKKYMTNSMLDHHYFWTHNAWNLYKYKEFDPSSKKKPAYFPVRRDSSTQES